MAPTLKRTQMYFPEDMLQQIRQLADNEHSSIAEIVRAAVGDFLEKKKKKSVDWDNDPLWGIVGQASSADGDLSVNHDDYLYGGKQ
jgi:metal-responsive CopG/Arc/MetJ family transcriptional regulator